MKDTIRRNKSFEPEASPLVQSDTLVHVEHMACFGASYLEFVDRSLAEGAVLLEGELGHARGVLIADARVEGGDEH